jgi:putative heme iron utilization protein
MAPCAAWRRNERENGMSETAAAAQRPPLAERLKQNADGVLHGDRPIGGHIRYENCKHIAFVSRPFMGRPSRSLQFFNDAGEAMFKVFVRRDKERNLLPDQVARFDALRARMAGSG